MIKDIGNCIVHANSCLKSIEQETLNKNSISHNFNFFQRLGEAVKECLKEADRQGHGSISFPAIGTGGQQYPKDAVATEMFSTVANFAKEHPNSSVSSVRFVVYYKDTESYQVSFGRGRVTF